jgi:hypothetical protein
MLTILFGRLFDLSIDRDPRVAEMIVEEEGVKKINWRWRRGWFQWEKDMVDVCSGLVVGVKRKWKERRGTRSVVGQETFGII